MILYIILYVSVTSFLQHRQLEDKRNCVATCEGLAVRFVPRTVVVTAHAPAQQQRAVKGRVRVFLRVFLGLGLGAPRLA